VDVYQAGIDHHLAPLAVRERVALDPDGASALSRALCAEPWVAEALVVSTCNRTEAYVATAQPDGADLVLLGLLRHLPKAPPPENGHYRRLAGDAAALHLIRVATGLESAILGETEIQGQVRAAHERGLREGTVGPVLDRLCQAALRAGRRARAETKISAGSVSHGHAAAQVVRRVFDPARLRSVLVVGAGEVATQAARALVAGGAPRFVIANRTPEHARTLAQALPEARVVPLDEVPAELAGAEVAILAAGSTALPRATVEAALARRRDPLLLLDLGVPRCAEPECDDLPGVFLYDLEALEALVAGALSGRGDAAPRGGG
jgi:glutamyl-tRNA reductase